MHSTAAPTARLAGQRFAQRLAKRAGGKREERGCGSIPCWKPAGVLDGRLPTCGQPPPPKPPPRPPMPGPGCPSNGWLLGGGCLSGGCWLLPFMKSSVLGAPSCCCCCCSHCVFRLGRRGSPPSRPPPAAPAPGNPEGPPPMEGRAKRGTEPPAAARPAAPWPGVGCCALPDGPTAAAAAAASCCWSVSSWSALRRGLGPACAAPPCCACWPCCSCSKRWCREGEDRSVPAPALALSPPPPPCCACCSASSSAGLASKDCWVGPCPTPSCPGVPPLPLPSLPDGGRSSSPPPPAPAAAAAAATAAAATAATALPPPPLPSLAAASCCLVSRTSCRRGQREMPSRLPDRTEKAGSSFEPGGPSSAHRK